LVRIKEDRFVDAVAFLRMGINDIKGDPFQSEAGRFLARTSVRDGAMSKLSAIFRLGAEIRGNSLGRSPFITKKGHLVLASEHVQPGDVVALIRGAQVPFILRRQSSGQYQVIGEAYVDGIMDGEAMESSKCHAVD
ncbi:uncharacterized protein BDZ99DRAFT_339206, partial [Mytilinidion resinicola]